MKFRFLNTRNCKALLPMHVGILIERQLDAYLHNTNQGGSGHADLIDQLIKHNEITIGKPFRLYKTAHPIDLGLTVVSGRSDGRQGILCTTMNGPPNEPIKLHLVFNYQDGSHWKILMPLQYLLKGWGDADEGYQCYVHVIATHMKPATISISSSGMEQQYPQQSDLQNIKEYYYYGITGRNWLKRLDEHLYEIRSGGQKRFHRAWRENLGAKEVLYTSTLMLVNQTFESAMRWEEWIVDSHEAASGNNGLLNMIPGGLKGLRFLHEHRFTDSVNISLEERDKAIGEYARQHPRKGVPNPFISALWEDDDFYLRNIEAREKTLSADQVRQVRKLHEIGWSISEITKEVGALNEIQVKNVVTGRTYQRVH